MANKNANSLFQENCQKTSAVAVCDILTTFAVNNFKLQIVLLYYSNVVQFQPLKNKKKKTKQRRGLCNDVDKSRVKELFP